MDQQALTVAFSVWAVIVGMIGATIVWELSRLRSEVASMAELLNKHILLAERRQTHTETFLGLKHDDYTPLTRGT